MYFTDKKENEINELAHKLYSRKTNFEINAGRIVINNMAVCKIEELHETMRQLEALQNAIISVTGLVV